MYDREVKKRTFIMIGASMGSYWADEGGEANFRGVVHTVSTWYDFALMERLFTDAGSTIVGSSKRTTQSMLTMYLTNAAKLADVNDVTYIYIAGHGGDWGEIEMAYGERLSTDDLCAMIGKIPGKVNLFIDSCYTGWFVVSYAMNHEWDENRYCIITNGGYNETGASEGGTRWFNLAYDWLSMVHRAANQNRMTLGYFYDRTKTVFGGHWFKPMGFFTDIARYWTLVNPPLHYGNDENILFDFNK